MKARAAARATRSTAPAPIVDRQWRGQKSWNRERIEIMGKTPGFRDGVRVRFTFKLDAYDFQSYAKAEVWKGAVQGWTAVHSIPGQLLKAVGSYVSATAKPDMFDADLAELRRVATLVLS